MTTRRRPRAMRAVRGNPSPAPPHSQITIATVSQTAGKAAGGSTLSVTGTFFVSSMVALNADGSTFGTVSAVTPTSCTITTLAGTAGTTTNWHLHDLSRTDSAAQAFKYVAAPVLSATSPTSGPATLTNTGVQFSVTNLGGAGSGIPIAGSVGAGTINPASAVITDASHFTASFTAPGTGTDAVAVSVDGVAATGTVNFTGNPPPSELTATNTGTSGGSGTIAGANFVSGCTASVNINGTPTSLTITFNSSTSLNYVLPAGTYTAGVWNLTVTNPDGQSDTEAIFVISSSMSPPTIFGANLKGWWKADTGAKSGGSPATNGSLVDTLQDQSGNGFDLTAAGTARPTFNATASFCPTGLTYPSITFNGTANLLLASTPGVDASTDFVIFAVFKQLATNTNKMFVMWGTDNGGTVQRWAIGDASGVQTEWYASGGPSAGVTSMSGANIFWGGMHGTSGSYTTNVSLNNATPGTGTSTQTWGALPNRHFSVGGASDSSTFSNIEFVEAFIIAGHNPTSTEYKQAVSYLNFKYIARSPSFTTATVMYQTGVAFRIKGANFVAGATVDFQASLGVSTASTTLLSSSVIDVTMPGTSLTPGSYDITVTNPDGGSITQSNGFTVTSNAAFSPFTATGDTSCVGWYEGDNWTLNGSGVSALVDQSLLGNDMVQATAADQPTAVLADADFSGHNSWSLDGVQTFLGTSGNFTFRTVTPTMVIGSVTKIDASNPTGALVSWSNNNSGQFMSAGKPRTKWGGAVPTWGTATGGTVKWLLSVVPIGTSQTISIDVNNSGSPITATVSPGYAADPMQIGASAAASFGKAKMAAVAIFDTALNSTQLANVRAWGANFGA